MAVTLFDKTFALYIGAETIQERVKEMAAAMNAGLRGEDVVFIGILNGAFVFVSDLLRHLDFNAPVSFVKLSSYKGMASSGKVISLIGVGENLKGKTVVVLEDIVDSGKTISAILEQISVFKPFQVRIATLLLKPDVYNGTVEIDYVGFRIPNRFVVGYGLDYDGLGRNLKDLYVLDE